MTTHTPGLWRYAEGRDGKRRVYAGDGEVVRALSTNGFRRVGKAEREANSHLIAAAPELLAALREFCGDVEAAGIEQVEAEWPDLSVAYKKALTAISKAEGSR